MLASVTASADELPSTIDRPAGELGPSYLLDGGAIPFLWAPLASRILLDTYATPRASPLAFGSEGGAEKADWQMPGWGITGFGGLSALGMIASGDRARFYHVKGLAESLSTGVLVTGLIKVVVGRHRPDWSEDSNTPSSRRSFPSGHATQAYAIATYTALYLRGHVFNKLRGDQLLPWWEAVTYGGIATIATTLAAERVWHNRHHVSDVVIGGLLGTTASTLFYMYQDGRYDRHEAGRRKQLTIIPAQHGSGASVGLSFAW